MLINTATIQFIKEHINEDPLKLALQGKKYPDVNMAVAIAQIVGQKIAAEKVPSWAQTEGILYPSHLSMEQCSSEATAVYKAALMTGESFADLTAGFGIDCAFIAKNFKRATYVERQEELCDIARHNYDLLGLSHVTVVNGDGVDYLAQMNDVDWIFLDPARRNKQGGKTVAIEDCEPNVASLWKALLGKAKRVMIKLSPMLDISLALQSLSFVSQVHIISVANECKELLIVLDRDYEAKEPTLICVNIAKDGSDQLYTFTKQEEAIDCSYANEIGHFVYEPNASILKAGAYKSIARRFELTKLHPNSHLYTSDQFVADFPGRKFECESVFGLGKKEIKSHLADIKKANITIRNFPSTVDDLRKRIKLSDGGDVFLFATTIYDDQKVLVKCKKVSL